MEICGIKNLVWLLIKARAPGSVVCYTDGRICYNGPDGQGPISNADEFNLPAEGVFAQPSSRAIA